LADVLDQIEVTKDSYTDLSGSRVTLDASLSVNSLSKFIETCWMDTTLRLPKLPTYKSRCQQLANAMQQRKSHAQLKVLFSQGHRNGEFVLTKWSHEDLREHAKTLN
jgi:hypothetical protein